MNQRPRSLAGPAGAALSILLLAHTADASPIQDTAAQESIFTIEVDRLELVDGDWESFERIGGWFDPTDLGVHLAVDGASEAYLVSDLSDGSWVMFPDVVDLVRGGTLVVRTAVREGLGGSLAVDSASANTRASIDGVLGEDAFTLAFTVPPEALVEGGPQELAYARARHYGALVGRDLPGAAWFRHLADRSRALLQEPGDAGGATASPSRLAERYGALGDAADAEVVRMRSESDELETFGLMSGGRALAENLQLDRLLPVADPEGATVPIGSIAGVTIPEFDWAPLVDGLDPALDPLAAQVPHDRYALFAPSLAALSDLLDELEVNGAPLVAALETRSRDTDARAFYERQLCAPLDGLARGLGALAVESVAIFGSDPYLRTGTDLAVVLETGQPELVATFLAGRQAEAMTAPEQPEQRTVAVAGREAVGVVSADRAISSFVTRGDGWVAITNSEPLLGVLDAIDRGERPSLAESDEYRFFRHRYPLGAPDEKAFVVVTDAAIRAWCGPHWRIATARRTRALALLDDLAIGTRLAEPLARLGLAPTAPVDDPRAAGSLGTVTTSPTGPVSSIYGSVAFVTPIAELEIETVTPREEQNYVQWRRGFERNWSQVFDPIGATIAMSEDRLALDVSILPLIAGSDYRDMIEVVGAEALEGSDGDPHPEAVLHFTSALDPEGDELQELGREISGFNEAFGPNALGWLGDWWSIHADPSDLLDDLLDAEDLDDAWDTIEADLDLLPIVFQVGVSKPLALAAFLTALRGMAESSAPGLVEWHTDRTDDGRPFVRVASAAISGDELALYYATTPRALVVSFNREALVAALDRWNPPADADGERPAPRDAEGPTPWLGTSAALELEPRALLYIGLMDRGDPRGIALEASHANLPALDEWRRLFPDRDPVEVHRELFDEWLRCPGGEYVWDEEAGRMVSTAYGHPGAPRMPGRVAALPTALRDLAKIRLGLTFEPEVDGLRARGELIRR